MFKNYVIKKFDFITLILLLIIATVGIIMVGSAAGINTPEGIAYRNRQILGFSTGFILLFVCVAFDYHWYKKLFVPIFIVNLGILSAVLVAGQISLGAKRWLAIGPFRFQPSEFSKIFLIILLAIYFDRFQDRINNVLVILGGLAITLSTIGPILKQPDLSTSVVIFMLFIFMIYVANISYYYIFTATAVAVPLGYFLYRYIQSPTQKLLEYYQWKRLMGLINPSVINADAVAQTDYSVIAIGSGQAVGKGLYQGKVNFYEYFPESHTDFIFSVWAEEFGFFGAILLLLLILLLISRLIYIGLNSADLMGKLIVAGIAALIGIQTFVNVGVTTGILPNTGLTFPFLSYGISSLWSNMIGIGIALNVSLQPKKSQSELNISGVNIVRKEVVK